MSLQRSSATAWMLALARVLRLLIFNQGDPALVSLAQARGSGKETPFSGGDGDERYSNNVTLCGGRCKLMCVFSLITYFGTLGAEMPGGIQQSMFFNKVFAGSRIV